MITAVMPSLHLLNAKETPNWFNHQYTLEYFADAAREDNFILNVVFLDHDRHSPDEAEKLLNRADVPAFLFSSLVPEHAPIIERLTAAGKTCVGRYFGRADFCHSVWFDMENAFLLAVKHLAGTGRKRIALLDSWSPELPQIPHYGYPIMRYPDVPAGAGTGGAPVHRRALPLLSAEHVRRRVGGAADAGGGAAFRCDSLRHRPACVRRARRAEKSGRSGSGRRRRDRAQQWRRVRRVRSAARFDRGVVRAIARELYVLLRELLASPASSGANSPAAHARAASSGGVGGRRCHRF